MNSTQQSPEVEIRAAASLLVVSRSQGVRVLMGRRPADASFMPGVYVFPGGALDPMDRRVTVVQELAERDVNLMRVDSRDQARALAIAAIRETLEETGILNCCGDSISATDWQDVVTGIRRPDLSQLRYLGRALTPRISQIRFHARFFFMVREIAELPLAATDELEDLRWVDPVAISGLPVARVTRFMLDELSRRLAMAVPPVAVPFYCGEAHGPDILYDALRSSGQE